MCCARVTTRWWPLTPGAVCNSGLEEGWLSGRGLRCGRCVASPPSFPGPAGRENRSACGGHARRVSGGGCPPMPAVALGQSLHVRAPPSQLWQRSSCLCPQGCGERRWGTGAGWGPTWLLVPQVPLQVALVKLLQMLGEPLVVGQAGRAHGADGLHPIGAVAAAMVTYSRQGRGSGQAGT